MVSLAGPLHVKIVYALPSLVSAADGSLVRLANVAVVRRHVSAVGGSVGDSVPSGITFYCLLLAQGHSMCYYCYLLVLLTRYGLGATLPIALEERLPRLWHLKSCF